MSTPRRAKRFLTAEQKYDLWQRMLTGQITTVEAAAEAGVDRSTVMTLRKTARDLLMSLEPLDELCSKLVGLGILGP